VLEAETALKAADVKLWSIDQPTLYDVQVIAATDTVRTTHFGIRKVEVRNAQLLLNGQPIKVAGGNRVVDYPGLRLAGTRLAGRKRYAADEGSGHGISTPDALHPHLKPFTTGPTATAC
jgi:hypothetical protein